MTPTERILEALQDPRFVWRTIPRLAIIAGGLTEDAVLDLLRPLPEVVFGENRDGAVIVRLRTRTPGAAQ